MQRKYSTKVEINKVGIEFIREAKDLEIQQLYFTCAVKKRRQTGDIKDFRRKTTDEIMHRQGFYTKPRYSIGIQKNWGIYSCLLLIMKYPTLS